MVYINDLSTFIADFCISVFLFSVLFPPLNIKYETIEWVGRQQATEGYSSFWNNFKRYRWILDSSGEKIHYFILFFAGMEHMEYYIYM